MDSNQVPYYTNLLSGDDLFVESTSTMFDHQEPSPQMEEVEVTVKKPCRGGNFTLDEDNQLVQSWIEISLDAVQGNEQKHKRYWQRVCEFFHENKTFDSHRNQNSLMNRWSVIQQAVNKFCGCLAQVESKHQSGQTEQDKIGKAKLLYYELKGTIFHFEHCWLLLRFHPKWVGHMETTNPKKKSAVKSRTNTQNSINLEEGEASPEAFVDLERPIGRKAEKNKRKTTEKTNPGVVVILNDINEDKKKKTKLFEEAREQDKEMFILKQEEVRLAQEGVHLKHKGVHLKERELNLREKEFQFKQEKEEREFRFKQEREEKEFMFMNTSQLDEDGIEYVRRRKKAILQGQIGNP